MEAIHRQLSDLLDYLKALDEKNRFDSCSGHTTPQLPEGFLYLVAL